MSKYKCEHFIPKGITFSQDGKDVILPRCGEPATMVVRDPAGQLTVSGRNLYRCTKHGCLFSHNLEKLLTPAPYVYLRGLNYG
jgi:hypothetical protein